MLRLVKFGVLQAAQKFGVFTIVAGSQWRRQRVVILCYHGISLKDEHEWWPHVYVTPQHFRSRLEILAAKHYHVLPLDSAVRMLQKGELPSKSVVITFDDGFHDFYQVGFPLLREFGFPATVYQTTYYCEHPVPIFNLALSYLFWRGKDRRLISNRFGVSGVFDLSSTEDCNRLLNALIKMTSRLGLTPAQKSELAAQISAELNVDYEEIRRLRMLQLMTPSQIIEIAAAGIDVQLHTHRHRAPVDEGLFAREIRENRRWLATKIGDRPRHFCYPDGECRSEFLPWLRTEQVLSATTCEFGIATRKCDPLLLPRQLDFMYTTREEFESGISGLAFLFPHRRHCHFT